MPTWLEVRNEVVKRGHDFDGARRERIRQVESITGRPLVIYATDFLNPQKVAFSGGEVAIDAIDKLGFVEAITNIEGETLDVLVHSPGGSAEATEAIVKLLRSSFSDIRFIVPYIAKSAATMLVCSGNMILVDDRSEIGPIDPQLVITGENGRLIQAPAQAVIDQFERAQREIQADNQRLPAWIPLLRQFGPALLSQCETASNLAEELVEGWLEKYMGLSEDDARQTARFLSTHSNFYSHGRFIGIDQMRELKLCVQDLRDAPELREAVWGLNCAIFVTFDGTPAFKIIENGQGDAFIRLIRTSNAPIPPQEAREDTTEDASDVEELNTSPHDQNTSC